MTLTSRGAVTCSFPNVALHPAISSSFYPLPICFYWEKFVQEGCPQKQHCMTPPPHPQHIWKSIGIDFRLHLPWLWTASENKHFRGTTWISPITTGSWLLAAGIVSQLTVEGEAATVLCKDEGNCLTIGCTHQWKKNIARFANWLIDWLEVIDEID